MIKTGFKCSSFGQGQGVSLSKSGAYPLVREHFWAAQNAAIGQKMDILTRFLFFCQ
jgi:hypothetical protein